MKCLVTGGAGFLGSHLIERLVLDKHSVVCLDDFSTGRRKNLANVESEIEIIEGDVRKVDIISEVIKGIDCVFHLAAQISVSRSVREPQFDASVNILGMITLLEAIKKESVKFIYISTGGAIYGEPASIPASESTFEEPISPYGLSKLVGEKYLQWFHREYGLPYIIIRPANIYGPRQNPLGEAGVISIFLGKIQNNESLEIFGDGTDTRDYVYVKDIAEICINAMYSASIDIFNAGTGNQTNLLELIDVIEQVTQFKAEKKFCDPRPGDVQHIALDSTKAYKNLGWRPSTNLTDGIEKTWKWFSSNQ
ncbi:MAG: NAD-dependent epimerase/dehydratase family protein [Candidatus Thorarchaeota archaeon]